MIKLKIKYILYSAYPRKVLYALYIAYPTGHSNHRTFLNSLGNIAEELSLQMKLHSRIHVLNVSGVKKFM